MSRYDIDNYMPLLEKLAAESAFILELGVGEGDGSTLAFQRGLERSSTRKRKLHISVDIAPDLRPQYKPTQDYWRMVIGDSREPKTLFQVKHLCGDNVPDIIFIDTDHTYEQMDAELKMWSCLAGENTVWLFHDTYMFSVYNPMADAIKEFAQKNGWVYEDIDTSPHGLAKMSRGK